jgi:tripartite-type tricarboxylate transporter receptor subunit TctC
MKIRLMAAVAYVAAIVFISGSAAAATDFYKGKTLSIQVGTTPGGGFDSYARALARHLGRHIPGNPSVIVENQPTAGGLMSANYVYKVAKPNGLTIGTFNGTLLFDQMLGQEGAEFDARKFQYIGALARVTPVCIVSKASGITDMDKWMRSTTPVKLGGLGPGNLAPDNTPKILKAAIGLPIQLITGYRGTAEVRLAVNSKEVAGGFLGWESAKTTWRKDLDSGDAFVVLQAVPKPLPDLPKVPLAISYAKTDEARKLIEAGIHGCGAFSRPFVVAPATPKDRVQILRTAFEETLKDKDFLADCAKAKLDLDPLSAQELTLAVESVMRLDSTTMTKLKDLVLK